MSAGHSPTNAPMLAFSFLNEENTMMSRRLGTSAPIMSLDINPLLATLYIASNSGCSVVYFDVNITMLSIIGSRNEGMNPHQKESLSVFFFFL